jgi:hypothetical protein
MALPSKHSLPFIVWNEKTGKYSVSDEAAEYLCSFDGKIGEYCVQAGTNSVNHVDVVDLSHFFGITAIIGALLVF